MTACPLLQPDAAGKISGGYLYNARMAEQGAWRVVDVKPSELAVVASGFEAPSLVLLDSLFLQPDYAPVFEGFAQRAVRVGLMLHSFPSLVEAADRRLGQTQKHGAEPTAFELDTLRKLCCVVAPGPHYVDVIAGAGVPLVLAEPGIDAAWRIPPRARGGPCKLVSVGSVTPRKGFLDVAEALATRAAVDYTWTVVGSLEADEAYASRLERACAGLPVALLGQRDPDGVRALVGGSDVLVMPSYDENHPLVLLEALAASVPVVAYRAGAASEMLTDGTHGQLAQVGDRAALAAALDRVIGDVSLHAAMARACWERQAAIPSWATTAERTRLSLAKLQALTR